ncbi:nicotinate phosphoribosyltransferase [Candidatus Falkowbacteria bacterium]|jgi:nicotinate phosphoribosyltransferase|nr:nicotinate phosphoribosyltransferase [Candidatus Falkowbacteria bacterium]MBT7348976.1 nicotinate phosphoribosyltransferase [Candidatus Falkowbacteria bacterium]MBT7500297.1 nicotinate phosphoribosyltransferase [Candidatus Falkowbacteria bacterium]
MLDMKRLKEERKKIKKILYTPDEVKAIIAGIKPIIQGISDEDVYKFTMQQGAYLGQSFNGSKNFCDLDVEYDFNDRKGTVYPEGFADAVTRQVRLMGNMRLQDWERKGFESMSWFKRSYLDFLSSYRYDPSEVTVRQDRKGRLFIKVNGPWYRTILWEVPILAIVSELYFHMTGQTPNVETFETNLVNKTFNFNRPGFTYIDFGTRRRVSYLTQEAVCLYMAQTIPDNFLGTSNCYIAFKNGLKAFGTHAHEWFMAHQAMFGTRMANEMGLESWVRMYDGALGIALTDTFTTANFLEAFGKRYAELFTGVRHDSGCPFEFGEAIIKHYERLGIDPKSKAIVFSDGLDDKLAVELHEKFYGRIGVSFGIGTFLSNDVGFKPLSIVIKISKCRWLGTERWIYVVKLSDNPAKHHGPPEAITNTQYDIGLAA